MHIRFLDLYKQHEAIKPELDDAIQRVIDESAFIGGRFVREFENSYAAYLNVQQCIGVGNGTDALEIALEALALPSGSEVIVPANSFIATSEAVTRAGHRVVFCDVDPISLTLAPEELLRHITPRTRAVIAVHLYGHPCDMASIMATAKAHDLWVIEDCAQAHGAEFQGNKAGTLGHIGTFSFFPGKNLGSLGDAGAIVTNSDELAHRCRMIANHGRQEKYEHIFEGRNSRLDGIQAAVLCVKLKYLDRWTDQRIDHAGHYHELLTLCPGIVLPEVHPQCKHVYHLYVIRVPDRDNLRKSLSANGIETGIHYPVPLHRQPAYHHLGLPEGSLPVAEEASRTILSLPIYPEMTNEQIEAVCEIIANNRNIASLEKTCAG